MGERPLIVECRTCPVRGQACRECIVPVVLAQPHGWLPLDDREHRAVSVLCTAGLIARSEVGAARARPETWPAAQLVAG